MKFLIKPTNGIWVAVQDSLDDLILRNTILRSEVCISDLDDTDAESPARRLAYEDLKTSRVFEPKFWFWGARSAYTILRNAGSTKKAEPEIWADYVRFFLTDKSREKIAKQFSEEKVSALLYPGVKDLYELMHATHKTYVTRNIREIAAAFASFLGFNEVLAEVSDKEKAVEDYLRRNPHRRRYFFKGDSHDDEGVLHVFDFFNRRRGIEAVTVFRADSPSRLNEKYDVNIGKNYKGLVGILTQKNH